MIGLTGKSSQTSVNTILKDLYLYLYKVQIVQQLILPWEQRKTFTECFMNTCRHIEEFIQHLTSLIEVHSNFFSYVNVYRVKCDDFYRYDQLLFFKDKQEVTVTVTAKGDNYMVNTFFFPELLRVNVTNVTKKQYLYEIHSLLPWMLITFWMNYKTTFTIFKGFICT